MTDQEKEKAIEAYIKKLNDMSMKLYGVPAGDEHLQSLRKKYQKLFKVGSDE